METPIQVSKIMLEQVQKTLSQQTQTSDRKGCGIYRKIENESNI